MRAWAFLFLGGCGGNACTCLFAYGNGDMSEAEVAALPGAAEECFGTDPVEIEANATCLPQTIGREAATSLDLVAAFDGERITFTYAEVGVQDCCPLGGVSQFDEAMTYVGCAPAPLVTATTCFTPP